MISVLPTQQLWPVESPWLWVSWAFLPSKPQEAIMRNPRCTSFKDQWIIYLTGFRTNLPFLLPKLNHNGTHIGLMWWFWKHRHNSASQGYKRTNQKGSAKILCNNEIFYKFNWQSSNLVWWYSGPNIVTSFWCLALLNCHVVNTQRQGCFNNCSCSITLFFCLWR